MFAPNIYETDKILIVSTSLWLRVASMPVFFFFFCWTVTILIAPIYIVAGGNTPEGWSLCIALAVLISLPMRLFWHGSQPLELRLYLNEGYYEMRRGFRRFTYSTRGNFSEIDHLTIWNKQENRYDVSYTTSLIWKIKRSPFTLHVSCNNQQDAVEWANNVSEKLRVPLYNRIRT